MALAQRDAGAESRAESLGRQLRQRRKELQLTMQAVADAAGLSVGFISQVERGLTAPSLSSLAEITLVLGVPLGRFLDEPRGQALTRRGQRKRFTIGSGAVTYERLSSNFAGSVLKSVIVHEPPGARGQPISHAGEEMIYVVEGGLTTEIEGEQTVLAPGDSIHFDSRRVHAAWNHTSGVTVVLWCGTVDVFGEQGPDPFDRGAAG